MPTIASSNLYAMQTHQTQLLSRNDVARLLDISTCMPAVEMAFRMHAEGQTIPPGLLGIHVGEGVFHFKTGAMQLSQNYFVAKVNANFPDNPKKYGLPTIQGVIMVCNADNGQVLAIMDSIEITIIRTGAATGVATKYLSRENSKVVTICGCGNQGIISLKAIMEVRDVQQVYAYDIDPDRAKEYADRLSREFRCAITPIGNVKEGTLQSDIIVTCTPSRQPILFKEDVKRGTFIAAVGADNEHKHEIDVELLAASKVVVDISEQSATTGDLHHAIEQGVVHISHIHAELGEIISGKKPGRTHAEEIIVFDSTGTGLQDVVSAAIVFENAMNHTIGTHFKF